MKYRGLLAACLAAATAMPAQAAVYDAFSAFNGTQGAGNFYYLKVNGANPATPLTVNTGCLFGLACLQTPDLDDGPAFYKSTLTPFSVNTVLVPNDRLVALPDASGVIVSFIAPTAGTYTVFGQFNALDSQATGVGILSFGPGGSSPVQPANSVPQNVTFNSVLQLAAGQGVGFLILPGAIADHDATGFTFRVSSAVPEPATWAMMIAGFGLVGASVRRDRTRATVAYAI